MKNLFIFKLVTISTLLFGISTLTFAQSDKDFGSSVEKLLNDQSNKYFGIKEPLKNSAPTSAVPFRTENQKAEDQVVFAKGLKVKYLTRNVGNKTDMFELYPEDNPTHLVSCVEGGRELIAIPDKYNPSVQRVNLETGEVETILRGMDRCDGIRLTSWGTILATEETNDGAGYEILDPLNVTDETVIDRTAGIVSDPFHIAKREALPVMAWEGLTVLTNGVVIAGDELRPGTSNPDIDGGSIFKFVPNIPKTDDTKIINLDDSPFVAGIVYALQISCRDSKQQFGQGCEVGNGSWIEVNAATAREDAYTVGATGYYRPEDLHKDILFEAPLDNPNAVRFCWTNTGNESANNFGEVFCAVDFEPLATDPDGRTVIANRFVEGDNDFNSFDNLAFQPGTGNLYVIEDHINGDIFACLPDGEDRNIKTDGCVKILSVNDSSAEPTGFTFNRDGTTAYLSIQHSNDLLIPDFDDYPTDDILIIEGFQIKNIDNEIDKEKDDKK